MSLIVKIGADTRTFQREMKKLTRDIRGVTDQLRAQGESMATALTAPLSALGLVSGTVASSFSDATGRMQAQLGLTSKEAEKLNGVAQDLWKKGFGESIGEASDMVANVAQNMRNIPTDQLGKVAEEAMTIAKVFDQDINDVTKTANQLMTVFGMTSTEAFDYMTKGFQEGLNYSGEFLDSLNEYAPQFDALGFSGEDFFNTLAAGAEAGAFQLDKVGDAVKEFNIRAQDGSKTTAEGFAMIGMNAEEMGRIFAEGGPKAREAFTEVVQAISQIEDPVKRNAAGVALFGTMFEDLEQDVMAALTTTSGAFDDVEGATKKAGDAVQQSLGEQFKQTLRETQSALEPLGQVLMNIANEILPKVSGALSAVAGWFSKLSPETQTFIAVIGMMAAALGPVLIIISSLVNAFATVKAALLAIKVVTLGTLGVWVAVGAAIAVLVAAIIIYWDEIVAATKACWEWIKDFLSGLWDGIVSTAQAVWGPVSEFFSGLWEGIKSVTETVWNAIKDFFSQWGLTILAVITGPIGILVGLVVKYWDEIKAATQVVWEAIKSFLSSVWNGIVSVFSPIFNTIVTVIQTVWNTIKTVTSAVWEFIKQYLTALWNALMYFVKPVFDSIANYVKTAWDNIKNTSSTVWNAIKSFLSTIWNGIKSVATTVWNSIKSFFTTWLNGVKSVMSTVWNAIKSTVTTVWNGIKSTASSVWNAIKNTVMGPINSLKSMATSAFNSLKSSVSSIFNSIKSTALSIWNSITSSVTGAVRNLVSGVTGAFNGMKSAVLGVWNGLKSAMKSVINGIISMVNKFIGGFNAPAKLLNKIPGVDAPTIPKIPMLATGGTIFGSGAAIVGEAGPELVQKSGSSVKVTPLSSQEKAQGIGGALGGGFQGTVEVPVNIDGKQVARVVAPFMDSALRGRRDSKNRARGGW